MAPARVLPVDTVDSARGTEQCAARVPAPADGAGTLDEPQRRVGLHGPVWTDAVLPAPPPASEYHERILVPYPTESALSGIQRHDDQMWYRKVFKLPSTWRGRHVLLHFGAVDQIATVWVNNQQVAHHEGGYTEFSADITRALRPGSQQQLTVRVEDRNEANPFPVGKQRNRPEGLFYTGASGIWQTVWLEPVRAEHIDKLDITSDLTGFTITPRVSGTDNERVPGGRLQAGRRGSDGALGPPGAPLRVPVLNPRLWTPMTRTCTTSRSGS